MNKTLNKEIINGWVEELANVPDEEVKLELNITLEKDDARFFRMLEKIAQQISDTEEIKNNSENLSNYLATSMLLTAIKTELQGLQYAFYTNSPVETTDGN